MTYFIAVSIIFIFPIVTGASQLYGETLIYTIEEGDTLESIVERFKVSIASLIKINRFQNLEQAQQNIVRGQSILIPESDIVFASVGEQGIETEPSKPKIELARAPIKQPPKPSSEDTPVNIEPNAQPNLSRPNEIENPNATANQYTEYKVQSGDTLSLLAVRFGIDAIHIRKWNQLDSDKIRIGQTLRIPAFNTSAKPDDKTGEASYTVEDGDTLLGISRKIKVSIGVIRALNQLKDDYIQVGQILRISSYEQTVRTIANNRQANQGNLKNQESRENEKYQKKSSYFVKKGDTLSSISRQFNISLKQLQSWNKITNVDKLRIGKQLVVSLPKNPSTNEYTVKKGDTLWSIARQFGLNVTELQNYNPNLTPTLFPGQTIKVRKPVTVNLEILPENALPSLYQSKEEAEQEERANQAELDYQQLEIRKRQIKNLVPPASLPQAPKDKKRPIALRNYFSSAIPRVPRQPNISYYEEFTDDPLENYQIARKLMAKFDREIENMPKLSNDLAGYSVLIDPGHGGLDPGFNSQSQDGNGNPLYIIEDEYNYDYALRLYRQLKRNGAHVGLTILSPNHLIIDSPDASRTLVSQKNEVYNSPFINQRGEYKSWPIGTPAGLHKRVEVAESFYNGIAKNKRIFISLHNDNSPRDKDGRLVLFYKDPLSTDRLGQQFAESLVSNLGPNARMRGQNLAVIRRNPARYAVLVELRNIAYSRNSWAIRNADLRQEDTEMLAEGVLDFVRSLNRVS